MTSDYGDRVCYTEKENVHWLGVVVEAKNRIIIRLDSGKIITVKEDDIFKVSYWKEVKKPFRNKAAMEKYTTFVSNLNQFKARKATPLTLPLLISMWYWLNHHAFNGVLHSITIKTMKAKNPLGLYRSGGEEGDRILISEYLPTFSAIFSVMAHEMVHQLNYEYDIPHGIYKPDQVNPDKGHGYGFIKEAEKASKKIGVKIETSYDDVEVDGVKNSDTAVDFTDAAKIKRYAFILLRSTAGGIYGFIVKQKSKLGPTKAELNRWMIRNNFWDKGMWGGTSDLAIPAKYLNVYNPDKALRYKALSTDAVKMLKFNFKPLDILEGPDKMRG